jgi:hypothetical protein
MKTTLISMRRCSAILAGMLLSGPSMLLADAELDRLEARLIELERELATEARTLDLSVSPPDVSVHIDDVEYHDGDAISYLPDAQLSVNAGNEDFKPVTAVLLPTDEHARLLVELCPFTRLEEYLYQPPDQMSSTPAGPAEVRFDETCPEAVEAGRDMADRACAMTYEGGRRDPTKYFTLRQYFPDGEQSSCLMIAECVVSTTVTPPKVTRQRKVANDACTSTTTLQ